MTKKLIKYRFDGKILYLAKDVHLTPNEAFAMNKERARRQIAHINVCRMQIEFLNNYWD